MIRIAVATLALTALPALAHADCPEPVTVARAHSDERAILRLVECDGSPALASLEELSLLARPARTDRPEPGARAVYQREAPPERVAEFVHPGIRRLDPGLLVRLQAVAARFPDATLEIVSGYRPTARSGSRHRVGRALDIRVVGVDRREVAEHARGFAETGVGYYPNSTFTHIDVRDTSHHWVDLSGPGERPRYVPWEEAPPAVDGETAVAVNDVEPPAEPADLAWPGSSSAFAPELSPFRAQWGLPRVTAVHS